MFNACLNDKYEWLSAIVSIGASPSDAFKELPVSQTREQFIEDALSRHLADLKRNRYRVWRFDGGVKWCIAAEYFDQYIAKSPDG